MPSLRKSTCNYCGIEKAETQRPMELCAWPSALDLCHLFHMTHFLLLLAWLVSSVRRGRLKTCRLTRTAKKRLTALIPTHCHTERAQNCDSQAFINASVCKTGDKRFTLE